MHVLRQLCRGFCTIIIAELYMLISHTCTCFCTKPMLFISSAIYDFAMLFYAIFLITPYYKKHAIYAISILYF